MAAMLPKSHVMILTIGFLLGILIFTTVTYLGKIAAVSSGPVKEYPDVEEFGNHSLNELHHKGEDTVAQKIAEQVRILCWVLTSPETHKKAKHIQATWGRRCNILLFMSSEADISVPTVKLSTMDDYNYSWEETKQAWKYVHDRYLQDADWFFTADDDTYTVVENLRYMLSGFNTSDPLIFGSHFKTDYMTEVAGYALSREAVKRFVEGAVYNESKCLQDGSGLQDLELAKCLQSLGVISVDTRDSYGRRRFFNVAPETDIVPGDLPEDLWHWSFLYYCIKMGVSSCSDTAITFHRVSPSQMHVLEYLVYYLQLHGISYEHNVTPEPDMYTDSSLAEASAGSSLNEKSYHPLKLKIAQVS